MSLMTLEGLLVNEIDWPRGQTKFLRARITLTDDLEQPLDIDDELPVAFCLDHDTFDEDTFHTGEWIGDVDSTRVCRVLVDDAMLPDYAAISVLVRITDNPETELVRVGTLNIT